MDIKTFVNIASNLPSDIAILMRGPTGIGKSQVAKAIAESKDLPFIDVRGSTMSEGDVGGYPDIEGMKESGVMTFCMPAWFIRATKEPVVIMLDEMNRSLPGVQQSFFQLVLDRELGNDKNGIPYRLHPQTRVIAAVNHGSEYDVNEMDPALLRRFWVADLMPTADDWVEWARNNDIDEVLINFIIQHPEHLRVDPSEVEPGTITPNPASWHRIDHCLNHMNMKPSDFAGHPTPAGFYGLCQGMVGNEAAIAFSVFVKEYEMQISSEDLLKGKVDEAVLSSMETSTKNALIDKLSHHCKENTWTMKECTRVADWAKSLSGELMIHLWTKITDSQNLPNIQKIHKLMGKEVVTAVQASRNLG